MEKYSDFIVKAKKVDKHLKSNRHKRYYSFRSESSFKQILISWFIAFDNVLQRDPFEHVSKLILELEELIPNVQTELSASILDADKLVGLHDELDSLKENFSDWQVKISKKDPRRKHIESAKQLISELDNWVKNYAADNLVEEKNPKIKKNKTNPEIAYAINMVFGFWFSNLKKEEKIVLLDHITGKSGTAIYNEIGLNNLSQTKKAEINQKLYPIKLKLKEVKK